MAHEIRPGIVHSSLVRVAGDGQVLDTAALAARSAGDALKDAFGTAADAAAVFAGFWSARSDTTPAHGFATRAAGGGVSGNTPIMTAAARGGNRGPAKFHPAAARRILSRTHPAELP